MPTSLFDAFGADRNIPSKLADRVRLEQIDGAARLAPFSALVSGSVVIVVAATAWPQGPRWYVLSLLLSMEAVVVAILLACWRWHRARNRRSSTTGGKPFAVTAAAVLGLLWASMPIVLFPSAGADERLLLGGTAIGLICTGIVIAPLLEAALAFVSPLLIGCFVAIYLPGDIFFAFIAVLLVVYSIFIVSSAAYLHRLFMQRLLQQLQLEEQGEIIRLLLCDFDQSASDWLWETDVDGRLQNVSQRFAQVLNGHPTELEGVSLFTAICRHEQPAVQRNADWQKLANCVAEQVFFRDVVVPVRVDAEDRWWSLTGRPAFDKAGAFRGYRGVGSDVTAARAMEARTAHQARHDFLTGLPNRAFFLDALRASCEAASARGNPSALLLLDLDGFKAVNDRLGHDAGDEILRAVARRLSSSVREGDLIARLGGDEFTVLHCNATVDTAATLAMRIIERLSGPFRIDAAQASVGVSIGIALAPNAGERPDDLLRGADLALYSAKDAGRGTYRFFEKELESSIQERRGRVRELRQAVRAGGLTLLYQPIVSAQTVAIRGFEALLRWEHPERGLIPTGELIALAEDAGLLGEIGEWALRQACREAAGWSTSLRVAVNVSAAQFRDRSLAGIVAQALKQAGLPASRLELEITETVFMEATAANLDILHTLGAMGVRIALDDFGTGFSSLGYLRSLPFDKIKIDGSFVRDMTTDRHSAAIVHALIGLAASLGVATTAEAVETIDQFLMLRTLGCTEAQGFLFSRPLAASDIPGFLQAPRSLSLPAPPQPAGAVSLHDLPAGRLELGPAAQKVRG